ncbi:hypothetical protein JCM19053_144 [Vibrio sp. JCM 19053]|nr:hypothetical protein JCM19053_144 [Vibrio sp. JCM 19053]
MAPKKKAIKVSSMASVIRPALAKKSLFHNYITSSVGGKSPLSLRGLNVLAVIIFG